MKVKTRKLLIEYLKQKGLSEKISDNMLTFTFEAIRKCLLENRIVEIEDVCVLYSVKRKKTRRKVPTRGMIEIPESFVLHHSIDPIFKIALRKLK